MDELRILNICGHYAIEMKGVYTGFWVLMTRFYNSKEDLRNVCSGLLTNEEFDGLPVKTRA